ncbi:hypothetical protein J1N35_011722 [Gossypium stocksii]|uniref:Uncharacterized protein n=1 Tax=Gossypium stocksii TaxID=47602 RepID=A0A9D4ADL1_9ROSI|nr:hypothetical protein J1N35_011722 [Gossypium stocksii]
MYCIWINGKGTIEGLDEVRNGKIGLSIRYCHTVISCGNYDGEAPSFPEGTLWCLSINVRIGELKEWMECNRQGNIKITAWPWV